MDDKQRTEKWVAATLANDENSTDVELREHFIANGVHPDDADKYISYRAQFLRGVVVGNVMPWDPAAEARRQAGAAGGHTAAKRMSPRARKARAAAGAAARWSGPRPRWSTAAPVYLVEAWTVRGGRYVCSHTVAQDECRDWNHACERARLLAERNPGLVGAAVERQPEPPSFAAPITRAAAWQYRSGMLMPLQLGEGLATE
jgi:hypothetical protein